MRILRLTLLLLAPLTACKPIAFWSVDHANPDTLRTVQQGQLVGGEGRYGSHAWLGIPFAKPPVGERRWRKPQPPEAWSGVREALKFGDVCAQPGGALGGGKAGEIAGSEDCLTLSVWAPQFTPQTLPREGARLPVMVWIHGGGNSIGTAAYYEGGRLAAEQKVLVIGVQYRLGPFGWLRHAGLRAGADEVDGSGNYGTLDLIRSLEWVRDNAAAFGGDPGNVTIFGESAGGLDVYTLLLAPAAKGLFHRAIVESGGFWTSPLERAEAFTAADPSAHRNSSNEVLARIRVEQRKAKDTAEARAQLEAMAPEAVGVWMRSLATDTILKAYSTRSRAGMLDAPSVFPDGVVLPREEWLERFAAGDWNKVPVLVGSNRDEMRLFLFLEPGLTHRLFGILPRLDDEPSYVAAADVMSRFWKLNGVDRPVEAMLRSGASEVYAYRWDWRGEPTIAGADLSVMLGAAHGLEVPFVFGHFDMGRLSVAFDEQNAAGREMISSAMRQYWATFARTGSPGRGTSGALPEWHVARPNGPELEPSETHLLFDVPANGGLRMARLMEDQQSILADLFADQRLDARNKCKVLHELANFGHSLTRAEYEAEAACADFPFDGYPWK